MDIRRIFEYALLREHEGRRFFEQNAERMTHAVVADVFRKLAAEEEKHIEFVEQQIAALDGGSAFGTAQGTRLEESGFFSARATSEMLDQTVVEAMVPDLPVLRMAYLIERDFAEFYEMGARAAEGPARQVLEMLGRWERGHESLFKELHDRAFAQYADMPWGG